MKIIAIEGMDAAGKATQCELLRQKLGRLKEVTVHDFPHYPTPTGAIIGGHLRNHWRASINPVSWQGTPEQLEQADKLLNARVRQALFLADRCEWMGKFRNMLPDDSLLVLDRYYMSGVVYGHYDGLDKAWLYAIHQLLPQPDLYIYLDIPLEESFKRRPERRDTYETNRGVLEFVRRHYTLEFNEAREADQPWYAIDAMGDRGEVHERIWRLVNGTIL